MIRKLLIAVVLLVPTLVFGAPNDRDVLLTPGGTLYTIESLDPDVIGVDSPSTRVLQLTLRNGDDTTKHIVPATVAGATHAKPALAYDSYSDTLFVFWQKSPNAMSSELLFCSFNNGTWSEATSIDRSSYNVRFGLKIAATPYITTDGVETETQRLRMLSIHAIWWEQTGYGEEARYAMLSLEEGKVVKIDLRRLIDFTTGSRTELPAEVSEDFDRSIFRYPAIFTHPSNDKVDVVFADWDRNRFHSLTIRPILSHGVIRVPDGIWRGELPPPTGRIGATEVSIVQGSDTLALYTEGADEIRYLLHKDGEWSPSRSIKLSADLSANTAVRAIRRLATSE